MSPQAFRNNRSKTVNQAFRNRSMQPRAQKATQHASAKMSIWARGAVNHHVDRSSVEPIMLAMRRCRKYQTRYIKLSIIEWAKGGLSSPHPRALIGIQVPINVYIPCMYTTHLGKHKFRRNILIYVRIAVKTIHAREESISFSQPWTESKHLDTQPTFRGTYIHKSHRAMSARIRIT